AQRDADVLDRVVSVDLEVALGVHREVETAVLSQLGEHVVEEREPGRDSRLTRAVDLQLDPDRRLFGGVVGSSSAAHASTSRRAERKASFSAAVPTVTRRQPSSRGQVAQLRTSTERSTSSSHTLSPSL